METSKEEEEAISLNNSLIIRPQGSQASWCAAMRSASGEVFRSSYGPQNQFSRRNVLRKNLLRVGHCPEKLPNECHANPSDKQTGKQPICRMGFTQLHMG